jgi:hypothetical protein
VGLTTFMQTTQIHPLITVIWSKTRSIKGKGKPIRKNAVRSP